MKHIFLIILEIGLVISQSCREYGKVCDDDKACCGGCCMLGLCTDIYADCRVRTSPCLDFPCPPDQDCYIYQPEDCMGCASTPQCKDSLPAPSEITAAPRVYVPSINATQSTNGNELLICLLFLMLFIKLF